MNNDDSLVQTPQQEDEEYDTISEEQFKCFCEQVDEDQPRRDQEFIEFLEELVYSDEFKKTSLSTTDASTQVIPRYLDKYAKDTKDLVTSLTDDFHLTKYFQKRREIENKLKVREECEKNRKIRTSQEEAIAIIKEHILQSAQVHACHLQEIINNNLKRIENMLGKIDVRPEFKTKLVERVLSIKKTKYLQKIGKKKREVSIINKLVLERKRWRQIKAIQNKTYDYKVEKRAKIGGGDADNLKEAVVSAETLEGVEELPFEASAKGVVLNEHKKSIPEVPKIEGKKDRKGKKNKKGKDKKDKKSQKKSQKSEESSSSHKMSKDKKKQKKNKNKSKKDKKKSKKKGEEELILPNIPITNPRLKITPGDPELMIDIIRKHEELLRVIDEKKYFDEMMDEKELLYEKDETCYWKPNPILFNNFENGEIYKKKVTIINGGNYSKKIKLYAAIIDDGFDPYLINVDNFGIVLVVPGLSFAVNITFRPRFLDRVTYGKLIFISSEAQKSFYCQFSVPIKCIPYVEQVSITPTQLNFGRVPFWEVKNIQPKHLKITSTDKKSYRIGIKKILDEREMDDICKSVLNLSEHNDIAKILDEIANICHDFFIFSKYFAQLYPKSDLEIKVFAKNFANTGMYFERFECQFFEETEQATKLIGSQECTISAEITGHFIKIEPTIMDYGICTFGSVYQQKFKITNCDLTTHRLLVQFPSALKPYLSSNVAEIFVPGNTTREISIKILPREDMIDGFLPFYDADTDILKFPIKLMVTSRNCENVPPVKTTIFAILTDNLGLSLRPLNIEHAQQKVNDFMLDLGECMTRECIIAKIGLTNSSVAVQHFGFLDLPECITIVPNYGFGFLNPYQSRELKILFCPEFKDLRDCNYDCPKTNLTFRISVTTLKSIGASKKTFNQKNLKKSFEHVIYVMKNHKDNVLEDEMTKCLKSLKNSQECLEIAKALSSENVAVVQEHLETDTDVWQETKNLKSNENLFDDIKSNKIWLSANLLDPPVWFSHQFVRFPDTPCGSFSTISLQLKTKKHINDNKCICGLFDCETVDLLQFDIRFQITGHNPEITVEPTCGNLSSGNSIDLHLIVKPDIPKEVVEEKAKYLKMMKIIAEKRRHQLLKRQQEHEARLLREQKLMEQRMKKAEKKRKKNKGKKDKNSEKDVNSIAESNIVRKDSKEMERSLSDIHVDPNTIHINYFDLYPAEMVMWRDFEPTVIEGEFVCEVTYTGKNIKKKPDTLYLKAVCKIVSPSFIHNLDRQHLDFGCTAIGSSRRKILELQNIKEDAIQPNISLLSPVGPFYCPNIKDVLIPSEHILKVPITFKPVEDKNVSYQTCFTQN